MLSTKDFSGIEPFEKKVWLSSPTMHGDELRYMKEAYETNWMSTVGANINEAEKQIAQKVGCRYAVALSAGTAALHLATKLAGERLYGMARPSEGTLRGHKVFCSDMTFDATVNPVAYEDGEAVFIDTERDTWNMDPAALENLRRLQRDFVQRQQDYHGVFGRYVFNGQQGRRRQGPQVVNPVAGGRTLVPARGNRI